MKLWEHAIRVGERLEKADELLLLAVIGLAQEPNLAVAERHDIMEAACHAVSEARAQLFWAKQALPSALLTREALTDDQKDMRRGLDK